MKNNKKQPFKISVNSLNAVAFIAVIGKVIYERMGTYPHYTGSAFSGGEIAGILIPFLILIFPLFKKESRESLWDYKNIIISTAVLAVSLVLIIIMYSNKEYYSIMWIEEGHWAWNNCPPIRWDFWNIIGQNA